MRKSEWGPKLWSFLHACSFAFPEKPSDDQKKAFEDLLNALKVLVPCPECRDHYCEYIAGSPAPLECGDDLKAWLVEFHNNVNKRVGKQEFSYADALKTYSEEPEPTAKEEYGGRQYNNKQSCPGKSGGIWTYLWFLLILVICIAATIYFCRRRPALKASR